MSLLDEGESYISLLSNVLYQDDYNSLINTVKDKQDNVSLIKIDPISDNYYHESMEEDYCLFSFLYQNVKYYLEQKGMYGSKLQEGMAVVISKSAILFYKNFAHLDNYFRRGERTSNREICNPFEEIARLLLNAAANSYWLGVQKSKNVFEISNDKLNLNTKEEILSIADAMDENKLRKKIRSYCSEDIVTDIVTSLDSSDITSLNPISATLLKNRGVITEQLDKITSLNSNKLYYEKMFGGVMPVEAYSRFLTNFDNQVIYAKRNIGVYEKTKQLSKEG